MSDGRPPRRVVAFLATVPLLEGIREAELAELARVLRRRDVPAGEILWREGDEASGDAPDRRRARVGLAAAARRPGGRGRRPRAGERCSARSRCSTAVATRRTARVTERASLLSLSRADFAALVSRRHPTAFALKRRIAGIACARLRRQLAVLAASLGGDGPSRGRRDGDRRRPRVLRAAGQQVRATARELPRLRLARAVGLPHRRPLRPMPAGPHAGRRGSGLDRLLPDDERRRREGHRPRRPPHPRRTRRSRAWRSGTRA